MPKSSAQLDREISRFLGRGKGTASARRSHMTKGAVTADGKTPLYGHTSEATAYVVDDYPYGFRERTQIRYWLESKPKKGWRFVSQTLNPKTKRWNKPKASTYADFGGAMFLDDKGHVGWDGVGQYTDEKKMLAFVKAFPGADMSMIRRIIPLKLKVIRDLISGERYFTINGVKKPATEGETCDRRKDLAIWEEINVWLDQACHP